LVQCMRFQSMGKYQLGIVPNLQVDDKATSKG
jgi:hypothetical protein